LTEIFAAVVTVALSLLFLKVWKPRGGREAAERIGIPIDPTVEIESVEAQEVDTSDLTGSRIFMALVPYILVIVVFG
ncbi:L-lactate permease, partial [Barnesiella sp. GGCC_0306]|nr:L-lactate permease [Barnesiella sp. GGCC_0306]